MTLLSGLADITLGDNILKIHNHILVLLGDPSKSLNLRESC